MFRGAEVAGPEMDKEDGKRKAHLRIACAPELPADPRSCTTG